MTLRQAASGQREMVEAVWSGAFDEVARFRYHSSGGKSLWQGQFATKRHNRDGRVQPKS